MLRLTLVAVICTLALALPAEREKRQVNNCLNAFTNVPNPCENNPQNQVYFPHPTDNSKFIQCDRYGRMYIIQCPENLLYSVTTSTCRGGSAVTLPPNSGTELISSGTSGNPCTPQALAAGQIYFAVTGDQTKFIECDMLGHANIMPCPDTLIWDEARLSCVYAFSAGSGTATGTGTGSGSGTGSSSCSGTGSANNPCTAAAIQSKKLFYAHPDPTKFFQCDLWCDVFVVSCPAGLVWNQYYETCASAYLQVSGGK